MEQLLRHLAEHLGADAVLTGADAAEKAVSSWTRLGRPVAIVRPRTTQEVSFILKAANDAGAPIVTWGGKTGLVDGAVATDAIALSMERMNAIESIDPQASVMRVQAGCILQTACEAAEAQGLLLPLDLGARGSATIGGVVSTNAGGNRVIRYGMMRDMILGVEAVLADGTIVSSLNELIKNNTGYDIKQLFIGSEGTLGVVTRAVIRLRPQPLSQNTAFVAVPSFDKLPALLRYLERGLGGQLSAFEVMWPEFYEMVTTPPAVGKPILPHGSPYYVLVEALGSSQQDDADRFEQLLADCIEQEIASDAVLAKSRDESNRMWALRDDVGLIINKGPTFVFDVSLRISDMEAYVAELRELTLQKWPHASITVFGHMGDGNLHIIVGVGSKDAKREVEEIVYGALRPRGGSISAEHGIGLQKLHYLPWSRSEPELAVMRTLKAAFDPRNTLNPGKVLA